MQAVILAAGRGTRLKPLTEEIPKAMVSINDIPILELTIDRVIEAGATDITIVVHHFKEKIFDYFKDKNYDIKINYVVQEQTKGDGDALIYAEPYITDDKFLVVACDKLIPKNYLKNIIDDAYDGVMSVREVKDGRMYGVVLHENNLVKKIIEKSPEPPSNLANASMWFMPREIFSELKKLKKDHTGEFRIVYAVQSLINQGKNFRYELNNNILDIGKKEHLEKAQLLAKEWNLCKQ